MKAFSIYNYFENILANPVPVTSEREICFLCNLCNQSERCYCILANKKSVTHSKHLVIWQWLKSIGIRVFEIIFSSLILIISSPLMFWIAWIIKRDSPGPALFFQKRMGKSKLIKGTDILCSKKLRGNETHIQPDQWYWVPQVFSFVKFRTMYADARERYPKLYNYHFSGAEIEQISFKVDNDPRVTRVGKWLRASTLDELPNFWNLLLGDIKIIGPRPEIPEMLNNYKIYQMNKFTVKPGITGMAQINGRGRLNFQTTVAYDLNYVNNKSLTLDIRIFFQTLKKIITKEGAF